MAIKTVMRRTSRNKGKNRRMTKGQEREKRVFQLFVSILLFAAALVGKTVFPKQAKAWKDFAFKDVNIGESLSDFSEAALEGDAFIDALGELCIEVFGRKPE